LPALQAAMAEAPRELPGLKSTEAPLGTAPNGPPPPRSLSLFERSFVRGVAVRPVLETFLVCAVASLLTLRGILKLTGYPQLGGEGLHIAHIFWGGMFMLAALILLFVYITPNSRHLAAIVGGVGFGVFIDELGKYITSDGNYFYRPTVGLIYVIFVLLFVIFQGLRRFRPQSERERLANALELAKKAALHGWNRSDAAYLSELLEGCDQREPLVAALKRVLAEVDTSAHPRPNVFARLRDRLHYGYRRLMRVRIFPSLVVGFFVVNSLIELLETVILIDGVRSFILFTAALALAVIGIARVRQTRWTTARKRLWIAAVVAVSVALALSGASASEVHLPHLSFATGGQLVFSILVQIVIVIGVLQVAHSWLAGLRTFKRAVLLSIFLTQFFAFYSSQFAALTGLAVSLLIWITLRYMIAEEQERLGEMGKVNPSVE